MTSLVNIRDLLQSTTTAIENVITLETKLNESYENLINSTKAVEIAGLHKPNVISMIQQLKEQRDGLKNIQFAVECNLGDIEKSLQNRWADSIKKIPQKDEYALEGIKNWRISQFEMIPNSARIHEKLFREEGYKLMAAGFDLAINTDHGVGSIFKSEDGFVIELWQNLNKKYIHKKTFEEILDWVIDFYDNN